MNWKLLLFEAKGRIGKKSFWMAVLLLTLVGYVAGWVPYLGHLVEALLVYCWACVLSKRLHDRSLSGWWAAPFVMLALLLIMYDVWGTFVFLHATDRASVAHVPEAMGRKSAPFLLAQLAMLLWIGLMNARPEANKYGPPLGLENTPETPS